MIVVPTANTAQADWLPTNKLGLDEIKIDVPTKIEAFYLGSFATFLKFCGRLSFLRSSDLHVAVFFFLSSTDRGNSRVVVKSLLLSLSLLLLLLVLFFQKPLKSRSLFLLFFIIYAR